MKKLIFTVMSMCLFVLFSSNILAFTVEDEKEIPQVKGKCPKTMVVGDVIDCLRCHVEGNFELKETLPDSKYRYPNENTKIVNFNEEEIGYFILKDIEPDSIKDYIDYLKWKGIKHAVIEVFSPGGSLFGAWRIVGLMNMAKANGMIIETRCHGFAASAGFLIFISGSNGYRAISPQAEIMWHELLSTAFLKMSTPTSSEDEARILRHLQDTANEYIASRCNLNKEDLDQRVRNKEFWMNGKNAFDDGFADKFLGDK